MNPSPSLGMSDAPSETSRFDALLDAEIARMKDPSVNQPPAHRAPLSMNDYKQQVLAPLPRPTVDQVARYKASARKYFEDEVAKEGRGSLARRLYTVGAKAIPVLMPHEHGFPEFSADRLREYGHLDTYVLNRDNLTVRPDKLAYMDAVLPPEIIALAVPLPEDMQNPAQMDAFFQEFDQSVDQLIEMTKGNYA